MNSSSRRQQQCHRRLQLLLAIFGAAAPLAGAYRGTVPIFPDVAAGRKKAAAAAVRVEGSKRYDSSRTPLVLVHYDMTPCATPHLPLPSFQRQTEGRGRALGSMRYI